MAEAESGIKRSSSLWVFKCFTAGDDDEFCNLPVGPGRRKKCFRMIFSGVTKSVFSYSFRAKKHRRWKHSNESRDKLFSTKPDNQDVTNSSSLCSSSSSEAASSSSSSLTSASSHFSSSRSLGEKSVNNSSSTYEPKHKAIGSVLCLILVTLLAVIVWGKVCAIVCTSTWLWVVSCRRSIIEDPSVTIEHHV